MLELDDDTMEVRLNDVDRAILTEISENGRATTSLLSEEVDVSRTYTAERVRRLREHEYLTEVAPRVYDLTEKGRDEVGETIDGGGSIDRDELGDPPLEDHEDQLLDRDRIDLDLDDDLDGADVEAACDDLERALSQIPEGTPGRMAVEDAATRLGCDLDG